MVKEEVKEVEVILSQDQTVKGQDYKEGAKIKVPETTAKRMKVRELIK